MEDETYTIWQMLWRLALIVIAGTAVTVVLAAAAWNAL